jgi:homocysteine S-methyltransferase
MDDAVSEALRLPQLRGRPMVTDGGMETDLIFHHGVDLPCFAAFPLLESARGRELLADYYHGYAAIARRAGAGLVPRRRPLGRRPPSRLVNAGHPQT